MQPTAGQIKGRTGNHLSEKELMMRVAEKHGVDGETVREEIGEAIRQAKRSADTAARAFWDAVPEDASDNEIVQCIAALLVGSAMQELS